MPDTNMTAEDIVVFDKVSSGKIGDRASQVRDLFGVSTSLEVRCLYFCADIRFSKRHLECFTPARTYN